MEFISDLSSIDLFVILCLAGGVFAGFTQGIIRTLLNCVVVLVAFLIASFTARSAVRRARLLAGVHAGAPSGDRLRDPVRCPADRRLVRGAPDLAAQPAADPQALDEIGGAILGVLFVALIITFSMVVLDAFFVTAPDAAAVQAGLVRDFYEAMNSSVLVDFFRTALMPTFGIILSPLLPDDIADLLVAP